MPLKTQLCLQKLAARGHQRVILVGDGQEEMGETRALWATSS